ncbi:hypothetical protein FHL15_002746 [Xylaria flabelliformis]|uniref:Uncharacterized protein n=1 Tax=Xylaria flabelliformis TaxID=2512241 RepID=A0A553I8F9_9PEZI|nr:hypothetical protein FHL15_002746 [Xylaria flabelliformis]
MSYSRSAESASDPFARYKTNLTLGFRVEYNENSTFRGCSGSMIPRNPERGLDDGAFRDHFNWNCRRGGPFISFFGEWGRALRWRGTLIKLQKQNIVVIAVWLDGLEVFDASNVARYLDGPDNPRLSWHENEYLLHGGIYAEQYRILAKFRGDGDLEPVKLSVKDSQFVTSLPGDFVHSLGGLPVNPIITETQDITEAIKREVFAFTGDKSGFKLECLLLSMGGGLIRAKTILYSYYDGLSADLEMIN